MKIRLGAALPVLLGSLAAQPQPGFGITETTPMGMVFKNHNPDPSLPSQISFKWAPFQDQPPAITAPLPGSGAVHPDFRANIIGAAFNQDAGAVGYVFRMKSVSTLNDIHAMYYTGGEWVLMAGSAPVWSIMFVSVSNATASSNPWYANGSDVLGFYADNQSIPGILAGNAYREFEPTPPHTAGAPAHAGPNPDIEAFDLAMPNVFLTPTNGGTEWMPNTDKIAFTIPHDSDYVVNEKTLPYGSINGTHTKLTGTSVIQGTWDGTQWKDFHVIFDHREVSWLTPADQIDMIAIGKLGTSSTSLGNAITFSTEKIAGLPSYTMDQLHTAHRLPGSPTYRVGEIVRTTGQKVLDALGIQGDDEVDGGCLYDPEVNKAVGIMGTPIGSLGDFPVSVTALPSLIPGATTGGFFFTSFQLPAHSRLIGRNVRVNFKLNEPSNLAFNWGTHVLPLGTVNSLNVGQRWRFHLPMNKGIELELRIEVLHPTTNQVVSQSHETIIKW